MGNENWSWDDVIWGRSPLRPKTIKTYRKLGAPRAADPEEYRYKVTKQYADAGYSAAYAGKAMGYTRSAVLGFANRNGIKFHGPMGKPKKALEGK